MNKAMEMEALAKGVGKGQGMSKIYNSIRERAKLGVLDMNIDCSLMNENQAEVLREEGFEVKRVPDFRDGDFYSISWNSQPVKKQEQIYK